MCKKFKEIVTKLVGYPECFYKPTDKLLEGKFTKKDIKDLLISFYTDLEGINQELFEQMIMLYTDSQKVQLFETFLKKDKYLMLDELDRYEFIDFRF